MSHLCFCFLLFRIGIKIPALGHCCQVVEEYMLAKVLQNKGSVLEEWFSSGGVILPRRDSCTVWRLLCHS